MSHRWNILRALVLGWAVLGSAIVAVAAEAGAPSLPKTLEKLKANQPVTIVCLGDSVTGIYYHTGGRRAYAEMLGVALKTAYPQAEVTMVNAGISGNTTIDALKRLKKDVLDHKPDLVTVMFGLNDVVRVPKPQYEDNLGQIVAECRAIGAEVLLTTPNSVIDTASRPVAKLVEYCDAMKAVGQKLQVPVCDVYAAYDALHARDPLAWRLLLSDEIHPNMDGHKLNAETLCRAITGQELSLQTAGPPQPAMPKTLALLGSGKPVRVLAMPPYDEWIGPALRAVVPSAQIEVSRWPTAGQTLAQIEEATKAIRKSPPDLVLVAVPATLTPNASSPSEEVIRSYTWILNDALSFGLQEWDVVGIAPSVLQAPQNPEEKAADEFACRKILAQDLSALARPDNDASPPEKLLEAWLRAQLAGK